MPAPVEEYDVFVTWPRDRRVRRRTATCSPSSPGPATPTNYLPPGRNTSQKKLRGGRGSPYVVGETTPDHRVLRPDLRPVVVDHPTLRYGPVPLTAFPGAAAGRPHRDPPNPGLGGAARAWLADDSLAREVVLVRCGRRHPADGRCGRLDSQRRARSSRPLTGNLAPLDRRPHGVWDKTDQPPEWTDGRGAGLVWRRPARTAGIRLLAASRYPDPRAARGPVACAARLCAPAPPSRTAGADRLCVRGHVGLQSHQR